MKQAGCRETECPRANLSKSMGTIENGLKGRTPGAFANSTLRKTGESASQKAREGLRKAAGLAYGVAGVSPLTGTTLGR